MCGSVFRIPVSRISESQVSKSGSAGGQPLLLPVTSDLNPKVSHCNRSGPFAAFLIVSSSLFKMERGQFGPKFRGSLNGERRNVCWTTETPWLPPQITICRNDECVLKDNAQRTKWKVISPAGNEATVPSVCFLVPPPNREAIEMASR